MRHVEQGTTAGPRTMVSGARLSIRWFTETRPASLGGTNTAPSPLENGAGRAWSERRVMIIKAWRKGQWGFDYRGVEFGLRKPDRRVRGPGRAWCAAYFESATLDITINTDESEKRLEQLKKNCGIPAAR